MEITVQSQLEKVIKAKGWISKNQSEKEAACLEAMPPLLHGRWFLCLITRELRPIPVIGWWYSSVIFCQVFSVSGCAWLLSCLFLIFAGGRFASAAFLKSPWHVPWPTTQSRKILLLHRKLGCYLATYSNCSFCRADSNVLSLLFLSIFSKSPLLRSTIAWENMPLKSTSSHTPLMES